MDTFPARCEALFRTSSYSSASDNCVEVADLPNGNHAIRDSHHRGLGGLAFTRDAWDTFLDGIKSGEFEG
jgi:hypothetical protein